MCVDYRDLNRASPKDNFPLPYIDTLVDNTAKHSLFSFMDEFSSYNQIRIAPEDMEKTTFLTMWGTFCYKIMPFGLKIARATYQRVMVTLFHDMMHKEIEVYVDDMIAKSQGEDEHVVNFRKLRINSAWELGNEPFGQTVPFFFLYLCRPMLNFLMILATERGC